MNPADGNVNDLPTAADLTAAGGPSLPSSDPEQLGKIGRYKITRLIGEGGMGAVYEAEQDQPRRTVALKVIKPGLANPEMLRRFSQESQALGRLQHPGIAQIYEAGTADTGHGAQPYFAMEFIRGENLRDYAQSHHMNTRQRLEMMIKICDAVHHAHQRGLIHRDLKPGNILVDGTGQPKILDFGVARVTDSDAQATMQTDVGLVGTLAYMSPEQVLADPLELDTRSDVYALGVILYELLAERLPYVISKKLHEVLHTIREEDPSKLSSINRSFRGDIETIAAKALEKDKARRYASAAELGGDIARYLKDEPITAQPPSTMYQVQKFARRHKALVWSVAAIFLVVVIGGLLATWQAVRATKAERVAVDERNRAQAAEQTARDQRDRAVKAEGQAVDSAQQAVNSAEQAKLERDKAVAEKQRADTEAATAKAVSGFLQKNLFEQVSGGSSRGGSSDLSVTSALDRTASRIGETFAKEPLVEAGVREAIARAYGGLALYDKALEQVQRELELRRRFQGESDPDTLDGLDSIGSLYTAMGKLSDAERVLAGLVEKEERVLGREHRLTLQTKVKLAGVYGSLKRFEQAEPLMRDVVNAQKRHTGPTSSETLEASVSLASIYLNLKKNKEGLELANSTYESALRVFGENNPLTIYARSILLFASNDRNALATLSTVLTTVDSSSLPDLIIRTNLQAVAAINSGQPGTAEQPLLAALDVSRRAGAEDFTLLANLAAVYAAQKKYAEAEAIMPKIIKSPEAAKEANHQAFATALRQLANGYFRDGRFAEGEPHILRLTPLMRSRIGEQNQQTRIDMSLLGQTYASQGKYAQAEDMLTQVLAAQRRYADPEGPNTLMVEASLGWVLLQEKRYAEAEKMLRETAAVFQRTLPNSWERFNVDSLWGAGLAAQKKFTEAEPLLTSGYEGMGRSTRVTNAIVRFTREATGRAIVELYKNLGKSAQQGEWDARIKADAGNPK